MKKYLLTIFIVFTVLCFGSVLTSCSSPTAKPAVNVAYAASLENLFEGPISKGFLSSTGYDFKGYAGGSSLLANEIVSKDLKADIFISAGTSVNSLVMNKPIGINYYIVFGTSPLVFAYTASSKFYQQLKTKPWYDVVTEPGFKVGRTDPILDPKGKLTVTLVEKEAQQLNMPSLAGIVETNSNVFPEQDLVGRLESGQLDGGFFYLSEAVDQHLSYQSMANLSSGAVYTVGVVNVSKNKNGAVAFMNYLLSSSAQQIFNKNGIKTPTKFTLVGDKSSVPNSTLNILNSNK